MFFCPFNNGLPHCNYRINKQIQKVKDIMKDCFQLMKPEHLSYCQHKESQGSGIFYQFSNPANCPIVRIASISSGCYQLVFISGKHENIYLNNISMRCFVNTSLYQFNVKTVYYYSIKPFYYFF